MKKVFVSVFGDTIAAQVETLEYGNHKVWDSVSHMQLVAMLESEFDVMLDTQDIIDMSSFTKAKEILGKHGVNLHVSE